MRHHLALLYRPLLESVLNGRKTVECRLGRYRVPPHVSAATGDLIWLKEVGGPVRGVATIRSIKTFDALTPATLRQIRETWGEFIHAPAAFWRAHRGARLATLIWLEPVYPVEPFRIGKTDRRAWVVLDEPPIPLEKSQP